MKAFLWIGLILVVFVAFGGTISGVVEKAKAGIFGAVSQETGLTNGSASEGPRLSQPDGIVKDYRSHNEVELVDGRRIVLNIYVCDEGQGRERVRDYLRDTFPNGLRVHVVNDLNGYRLLRHTDHVDLAADVNRAFSSLGCQAA